MDAQTGVIGGLTLLPVKAPNAAALAEGLADFVSQARDPRSGTAPRASVLALGHFEDLSVNDKHIAFDQQLRADLTARFQPSLVTLVEREFVDTLLQELRLSLGGWTEDANPLTVMQLALWLVDGFYQSFETAGSEVELILRIERMRVSRWQRNFCGVPGEPFFAQLKTAI